ncbi:MAG: hypothetical protein KAS93_06730 [Gammaproteobacteria bacterium]|nr:hypothetical protein [Gammaproteobacteria bacterium]
MGEVKRLLEQIKSQAETNTDVEFYDQSDTRTEFQDLADLADTALIKHDNEFNVAVTALKNLYDLLAESGCEAGAVDFAGELLDQNEDAIIQENVDANN